jgi:hypothetical protein
MMGMDDKTIDKALYVVGGIVIALFCLGALFSYWHG